MRHRRFDGAKLRALRREREWRQVDLADKAGCSESFVKRVEMGYHQPSDPYAEVLARALGVTTDDLSEPQSEAA